MWLLYVVVFVGLILVGVFLYRKRRRSAQPKVKKEEVKMRGLQVAYSGKEKSKNLLKNLGNLQKQGSITEAQYSSLKNEYEQFLTDFIGRIEEIKEDLKRKMKGEKAEIKKLTSDLGILEARNKVGQISLTEFSKLRDRIQGRIQKKEEEVSRLEALINSKSSADLGGYIEVEVGEAKGTRLSLSDIFPSEFPGFTGLSEVLSSRLTLIPLICGIAIVITTFLPWASLDFGYGTRATDIGLGNGQGILSLIMGFCIIGLVFSNNWKIRGIGHLATGGIIVLCLISYWATVSGQTMGYEGLSPGFGFILCWIVVIIVIIAGVVEFRRA